MFLKRVFYASASVLMLALAYHLGAQTASAQAPGNPVVASFELNGSFVGGVVTANGDVYTTSISALDHGWTHRTNVFSGGPVPTQQQTWGAVKARYRGEHVASPQDR